MQCFLKPRPKLDFVQITDPLCLVGDLHFSYLVRRHFQTHQVPFTVEKSFLRYIFERLLCVRRSRLNKILVETENIVVTEIV